MPSPPSLHVAQFYENDRFLTESVVEFMKAGLQGNERVIIIATALHWQTLRNAFNPDELCNEHLTCFDATALLAELMVDDWPDHSIFMRVLGHPIQEACRKGRVRVYGEMGGRSMMIPAARNLRRSHGSVRISASVDHRSKR